MAKINVEKDNDSKSVWKYVLIGVLVVGLIVLLYYGFFIGATDEVEGVENPDVIEQSVSQDLDPYLLRAVA